MNTTRLISAVAMEGCFQASAVWTSWKKCHEKSKPTTDEVRLMRRFKKRCVVSDLRRRLAETILQMINPQMASAQGAAAIAMVSSNLQNFSEIDRMLKNRDIL